VPRPPLTRLRISLGGLDLALTADGCEIVAPDEGAYRAFVLPHDEGSPLGDPVRVRHEVEPAPRFDGPVIFQSSAAWEIRARGLERGIVAWAEGPLYAVHLTPGSGEVLVQCGPELVEAGPPREIRSPVHYPLDQLLAMYLLGGRGLIAHAAGMLVHGRGVALVGVSGAGKTTFSRLAAGRRGWTPLSDDRVIVRVEEGRAAVFGTPWPGEGAIAVNEAGPLDALLFLEQAETTAVRRLAPGEALARLVKAASVPWYDEDYVGETLDACGRLVRSVPTAVLAFRPDGGAVEAVERHLADESPVSNRAGTAGREAAK
jgi:hypothetical protein